LDAATPDGIVPLYQAFVFLLSSFGSSVVFRFALKGHCFNPAINTGFVVALKGHGFSRAV
jgi:hypothetical protein